MRLKPKFSLDLPERCEGNGYDLIERAASVLAASGNKKEAKDIHQAACVNGYRFYVCLKLLKKYMDI